MCWVNVPATRGVTHNYATWLPREAPRSHLSRLRSRPPAREQRGRSPFNSPPERPRCSGDAGPPEADQKAGDEGNPHPQPKPQPEPRPQPHQETRKGTLRRGARYVRKCAGSTCRPREALRTITLPGSLGKRLEVISPGYEVGRRRASSAVAAPSIHHPSDRAARATLGRRRRTRRPESKSHPPERERERERDRDRERERKR